MFSQKRFLVGSRLTFLNIRQISNSPFFRNFCEIHSFTTIGIFACWPTVTRD